jgi:hypothetical protein
MNHKLKVFIIIIVVVILSAVLSSYFGRLYENIIGRNVSAGWIGSCGECYEGFTIAFAFLAGLLLFGLLDKNRLNITIPFVIIFPIILLLAGIGEAFLSSLAAGLIGLGLGQLIYILRKKMVKK